MAIAVTYVDHANITTGNSVASASQSPAANELWCVDVYMRATGITPTVSGNGLTWVQEAQVDGQQSGPQLRLWRFRALSTSTPSSGAITVTVTGNTKPVTMIVWKATGISTVGTNGSGAFAQTVTDQGPSTDDANMTKTVTTINANAVVIGFGGYRTKLYTLQSGETSVDHDYVAGTGGDIVASTVMYKTATTAGSSVTLGASGSLSGAIDWAMIVSELKPGNVVFDDTITLAKTLAVSVTKNSNAFGSASLARSEGVTITKQSNTRGSTTLARAEGLTVTKNSTAYGSLALARTEGATVAGTARYQVSVSLSRSEGLTVTKQTNVLALITLARSEGLSLAQQSNTHGSVGLARSEGMTLAPQADTYGDASIAIHRSLVTSAYRQIAAQLTLGRTMGINDPVGMREFIASVSLSINKALSASAYKQSSVGVALGRSLSIAVAKQIAAQGYVTLPIALAVTVDGEQIIVTIIAPDLRTYNVAPEIRSFAIDRAADIDMAPDDRSFEV